MFAIFRPDDSKQRRPESNGNGENARSVLMESSPYGSIVVLVAEGTDAGG